MNDTLQATPPEAIEQTSIDTKLSKASSVIADLPFDPEFQAFMLKGRVSLETEDTEEYWRAVGNYTGNYFDSHSELTQLEKDSYAVVANLPLALISEYELNDTSQNLSHNKQRKAKQTACSYNQLLQHYVTEYPQESARLQRSLLGATIEIMGADSRTFTDQAERTIMTMLRGAKHEVGFTDILDELGVNHRDATVEEDLQGRDRIILFNGHEIGVDIKASLSEVEAKNRGASASPIAHKPNGDLVMFSMLLESDFAGTFRPNTDRVKAIAPAAGALLQKALFESIAKK